MLNVDSAFPLVEIYPIEVLMAIQEELWTRISAKKKKKKGNKLGISMNRRVVKNSVFNIMESTRKTGLMCS